MCDSSLSSPNSRHFHIRLFQPKDLDQCKSLFLVGQVENGNPIEYVEYTFKHDMADIMNNYIYATRSGLWVAVSSTSVSQQQDESQSSLIVGLVGIRPLLIGDPDYYSACSVSSDLPDPENEAELNRMAVHPDFRRSGIGRSLIATCRQFCHDQHYIGLHLSTLADMTTAIDFYTACGFHRYRVDRVDTSTVSWNQTADQPATAATNNSTPTSTRLALDAVPSIAEIRKDREKGILYQTHFRLQL